MFGLRSTIGCGCVLIIVGVFGFLFGEPGQNYDIARFTGCYLLSVGSWSPAMPASVIGLRTPPDTVRLFANRIEASPVHSWYQVAPPTVSSFNRGEQRAGWLPLDSTSFRIEWSNGFNGADLRLFKTGDSYFGVIRATSDVITSEDLVPKAIVNARAVSCAQSGR